MKTVLIIFIVLTVILLVPVGVDAGYNGNSFTLYARLGLINLKIFPSKKKRLKAELKKALKHKKEKKKKPPMEKEEIFALIKMGLKSLGRFKKRLSVNYFRLHFVAASDDPFNAALAYGYGSTVLGVAVPLVERAFNIKERDFSVTVDFFAEKSVFDVRLITSIQIWEILYIAFAFGIDFVQHKLRQKKKAGSKAKERNECNGQTSYRRSDRGHTKQN